MVSRPKHTKKQAVQAHMADKPVFPTISETCDTVVPDAAPRYKTLLPGAM